MRVVAGKYRHRLLIYPDDASHIRPTKDRIREAIFSSLGDLDNLDVLDLYSGSGAMGIEALSRNARSAVLVDNNKIAINTIKNNIANLGIKNATIIFDSDVNALDYFIKNKMSFDLIILDPPYKLGDYVGIINKILSSSLLNENGRIITECDHEFDLNNFPYTKFKTHRYGEIIVNVLYF